MISCVVACAPSETDFDQGVGCVTSSAYVKSVNVVKAVSVYGNQALRSNRKVSAAIRAVPDFHLGELCSVSKALKRKTKRRLRVPCGVHAEPEAIHCARAACIASEIERRIRRRNVRDEFIEYGANSWSNKETPRRKRISGGVDNCLVLQKRVQSSRAWRRNRGKGITFEIEIDYYIRIGFRCESAGKH